MITAAVSRSTGRTPSSSLSECSLDPGDEASADSARRLGVEWGERSSLPFRETRGLTPADRRVLDAEDDNVATDKPLSLDGFRRRCICDPGESD